MEFATDNLIARVLLTLNTLGYSLVPVFADFNRTHDADLAKKLEVDDELR